jgi:hypothetical protein
MRFKLKENLFHKGCVILKELLLDSVVNYRYTIINGKVVVIDYKGILPFIKVRKEKEMR